MTRGGKRGKLKQRVSPSSHRAWKSGRPRRIPTFPQRRRRLLHRHNFQTTPCRRCQEASTTGVKGDRHSCGESGRFSLKQEPRSERCGGVVDWALIDQLVGLSFTSRLLSSCCRTVCAIGPS